jgi:regulatory protein
MVNAAIITLTNKVNFANASQKHFTAEQALQKIRQYCAYQERCHKEVKEKLYSYGLHKSETDKIIADLLKVIT